MVVGQALPHYWITALALLHYFTATLSSHCSDALDLGCTWSATGIERLHVSSQLTTGTVIGGAGVQLQRTNTYDEHTVEAILFQLGH